MDEKMLGRKDEDGEQREREKFQMLTLPEDVVENDERDGKKVKSECVS